MKDGYIFERDIKDMTIEEAVEKYNLVELSAPGLPERVFEKRNPDEGVFDSVPDTVTMFAYEQFYCGNKLEYGRRRGFCALNPLNLCTQMCFSLELESILVSKITQLTVCGASLIVYPSQGYDKTTALEDMAVASLNEFLGFIDYDSDLVVRRWREAGMDLAYIYSKLNKPAKEWLGGI